MLDCQWSLRREAARGAGLMVAEGKPVGIVYNAHMSRAREFASALEERLRACARVWVRSIEEMAGEPDCARDASVVITVGGDGTILRVVPSIAPLGIPLMGINLGRIGFMTEFEEEEALEGVPGVLAGTGWVEERAMLQAEVLSAEKAGGARAPVVYHALNDVVVGRAVVSRMVRVRAVVDGVLLASYRVDALIVATATGSTGYSMAAGGPILPPSSRDIIIKPVAPHLSLDAAVVVPGTSTIELTTQSDTRCMVSVDGHIDVELAPDATVRVGKSPYVARFVRVHPPSHYYATLIQRLGLVWGQEGYRPER